LRGGAERYVLNLENWLESEGHQERPRRLGCSKEDL